MKILRKRFLLPALPLLGAVLLAVPALADPAGMAAHVKGPVQAGGKPLKLLQRLEPGTAVKVGASGEAVIVLFGNGARYRVAAGKTATVSAANVAGAEKLAALGGPSANVVQLLGGSRVGAVVSRKVTNTLQRLAPDFPGYYESATPQLTWPASAGAKAYTFTLFDSSDNVLWSTRTELPATAYPNTAPALTEKRPYLWRLTSFGATGKVIESRSGLLSILNVTDAAQLKQLEMGLKMQAEDGGDSTPLLLLADTYRAFGVTGRTLEILDDLALRGEPGAATARADVYAELSPLARVWGGQVVRPGG